MLPKQCLPVQPVTVGPKSHFFGYYDKLQWDPTDQYLLGMEVSFEGRTPSPTDPATLGLIDLSKKHSFHPLAQTRAWCWQQGCMLQWVPESDRFVIFNDRVADRFVSVVLDINSGKYRTLPRPVYAVSPDGRLALSLNFSRVAVTRPGYGYNGLRDHWEQDPAPGEDGIYLMDLETGNHTLIVDLASLAADLPQMSAHWVNHLLFSPSGDRFIFLHRWIEGNRRYTRLYTSDLNGDNLFRMPIEGASHFIWRDPEHILVWATTKEQGPHYYLCRDHDGPVAVVGEGILTRDGHCTYSPDGAWICTDEYPDKHGYRPLILFNVKTNQRYDIASLYGPFPDNHEFRCDLHPRWSRDGNTLCIDSVHEGRRQIYLVTVGDFLSSSALW